MERLHGMKHDFVVHGPAKQRMRMAYESGMRGVCIAHVEQGFEAAGRAVEKQ